MSTTPERRWLNGPESAPTVFLFAHGAGAPADSEFMEGLAQRMATLPTPLRVVRFEFPYMAQRRADGRKRPPNGARVLERTLREVVAHTRATLRPGQRLILGGKSMGGRVSSMLADELSADGLLCLGYPFHPTGRPEKLRVDHLRSLKTPALIVQGERDPFGTRAEVASYGLPAGLRLEWLPDGNHSFVPRKRSGHTVEQNLDRAARAIGAWLDSLT